MIDIGHPVLLWLALPLVLLWWLFVRLQTRAVRSIDATVVTRFRRRLSIYSTRSLRLHMGLLLLLGLLLLVAASGPSIRGRAETVTATGRLLFLVDASASMYADDVEPVAFERSDPANRLEVARQIALGLTERLEGFQFALASFSGSSAIHLPMIDDRVLLDQAIMTLETHSYYRNTGSSLAKALDLVPHFVDRRGYRLQVVLLSDGEQPFPEEYGAPLQALADQDIAVHTVAIGSEEGQSRMIFDFRDVVAKEEEPRVLREYTTRRVERHLKRISRKTGGSFKIAELGVIEELASAILREGSELTPVEHDAASLDVSRALLLLFLIGFLIDSLAFGHSRRKGTYDFDISRLGDPRFRPPVSPDRTSSKIIAIGLIAVTGLLSGCGDTPRGRAHRENELGIAQDALLLHGAARPHYERSRGYEIQPEIPTHNLARSVALSKDYSEAHDLFQQALLLRPELLEAHFNDGVTLYEWGVAERDPKDCELERTRELWLQADLRFRSVAESADPESHLARKALENRLALARKIAKVNHLIRNPPAHCGGASASDPSEALSGGGSEPDGGGGGGGADQNPESSGEQNETSGGGFGGESEEGEGEEGSGGSGGGAEGESESPSGGTGPLSADELQEIAGQIQELLQQGQAEGKYHRRTRPEQFPREDWLNPDSEIWW